MNNKELLLCQEQEGTRLINILKELKDKLILRDMMLRNHDSYIDILEKSNKSLEDENEILKCQNNRLQILVYRNEPIDKKEKCHVFQFHIHKIKSE